MAVFKFALDEFLVLLIKKWAKKHSSIESAKENRQGRKAVNLVVCWVEGDEGKEGKS